MNFKLLNDILIIFNVFFIYFLSLKELNNPLNSFIVSSFYLLMMSPAWATAEYSEIYSLLFINLAVLLLFKEIHILDSIFVGVFFSFSVMINIGTLVYLPIMLLKFKNNIFKSKYFLMIILGFTLPLLLLIVLYFINGLEKELFYTSFVIPLSYPSSSTFEINMLIDFLRGYFEYNLFLYIYIIFTIFNILFFIRKINKQIIALLVLSLFFVILASHGYYHHFIFLIFYLSLGSYYQLINHQSQISKIIFFVALISILTPASVKSIDNLSNYQTLQEDYPLYQVSNLIKNNSDNSKIAVLAVDYHLVNFYLGLDNASYIVHPTNHNEDFIVDNLIEIGKIKDNELSRLVNEIKPDFILCSENYSNFNCEVSDWVIYPDGKKVYKKVSLDEINALTNIHFYRDPYKKIRLYEKTYQSTD